MVKPFILQQCASNSFRLSTPFCMWYRLGSDAYLSKALIHGLAQPESCGTFHQQSPDFPQGWVSDVALASATVLIPSFQPHVREAHSLLSGVKHFGMRFDSHFFYNWVSHAIECVWTSANMQRDVSHSWFRALSLSWLSGAHCIQSAISSLWRVNFANSGRQLRGWSWWAISGTSNLENHLMSVLDWSQTHFRKCCFVRVRFVMDAKHRHRRNIKWLRVQVYNFYSPPRCTIHSTQISWSLRLKTFSSSHVHHLTEKVQIIASLLHIQPLREVISPPQNVSHILNHISLLYELRNGVSQRIEPRVSQCIEPTIHFQFCSDNPLAPGPLAQNPKASSAVFRACSSEGKASHLCWTMLLDIQIATCRFGGHMVLGIVRRRRGSESEVVGNDFYFGRECFDTQR
jgi:hypothetical protein